MISKEEVNVVLLGVCFGFWFVWFCCLNSKNKNKREKHKIIFLV